MRASWSRLGRFLRMGTPDGSRYPAFMAVTARFLFRSRIRTNFLTAFRGLISGLIIILYALLLYPRYLLLPFGLNLAAVLSDLMDGPIAELEGKKGDPLGKVLDPLADWGLFICNIPLLYMAARSCTLPHPFLIGLLAWVAATHILNIILLLDKVRRRTVDRIKITLTGRTKMNGYYLLIILIPLWMSFVSMDAAPLFLVMAANAILDGYNLLQKLTRPVTSDRTCQ